MTNCTFCDELHSPDLIHTKVTNWPYDDRFIFKNKFWTVMPGYSPQVYPYVLVLCNRHITSFFECTIEERFSFIDILFLLKSSPAFREEKINFFEHGGSVCGYSCIEHCHLHVISEEYDLLNEFKKREQVISIASNFYDYQGINNCYLLWGTYILNGSVTIDIAFPQKKEHQYFRKLLAEAIHDDRWNWREGINKEYMIRLAQLFKHSDYRV